MADLKARAREVNKRLAKRHPDAKCALDYTNAFELLIATILSAQSTDARVNIVTKSLFRKYPDPRAFAGASQVEMEKDVRQTGFFRNKAKAVIACATAIVERHGGEVPRTMDELTALPGVGRKTANVVLGNAFGINVGVVVDTHVARVSGRLGLTKEADPVKIEADLMGLVPREEWTIFAHRLIFHGRQTCIARKPQCGECVVEELCPSSQKNDVAPGFSRAKGGLKPAPTSIRAGRSSPASSTGRISRSAKPSSENPARSRASGSTRGRKPSRKG